MLRPGLMGHLTRAAAAVGAAWLALLLLTTATSPSSAGAPAPKVTRDVPYDLGGPHAAAEGFHTLDLYRPPTAEPGDARGVVVYVHGGGWMGGDKGHDVRRKARLFTDAGYLLASVNYRLSPSPPALADPGRVRFPAHARDVGEAVGWLHENVDRFGGSGRRMVLMGHSAGAQVASLVATAPRFLQAFRSPPSVVRGLVSLDAVALHVPRAIRDAASAARRALLLNAFGTPAEERADPRWSGASPLLHAGERDPAALVIQQDRPSPSAGGRRFADALGGNTRVLPVAMGHNEIEAAVGRGGAAERLTGAVLRFVDGALHRGPR